MKVSLDAPFRVLFRRTSSLSAVSGEMTSSGPLAPASVKFSEATRPPMHVTPFQSETDQPASAVPLQASPPPQEAKGLLFALPPVACMGKKHVCFHRACKFDK